MKKVLLLVALRMKMMIGGLNKSFQNFLLDKIVKMIPKQKNQFKQINKYKLLINHNLSHKLFKKFQKFKQIAYLMKLMLIVNLIKQS